MCRFLATTLLALALLACGEEPPAPPAPAPQPPILDPIVDPIVDPILDQAVRVWRLAPDELDMQEEDRLPGERVVRTWEEGDLVIEEVEHDPAADDEPFRALDDAAVLFLRVPSLRAAVQFSDASVGRPQEWRITTALTEGEPNARLLALAILMRVRAPRSVAEQWEALEAARLLEGHPELPALLAELDRAFAWESVESLIEREPPEGDYEVDHGLEWGLRAAGVARHWEALPRLRALTRSENLHTSLTAERSLEDFPGPEADDALVHCLLGWRYNAYVRAARALQKRHPELLERTLLENDAPEDCRYQQGVFLGRLGSPAAVPILCETLPRYQIIDREMFDLVEALATKEHRALVDALPAQVRENQRARADQVREHVRARLDGGEPEDR